MDDCKIREFTPERLEEVKRAWRDLAGEDEPEPQRGLFCARQSQTNRPSGGFLLRMKSYNDAAYASTAAMRVCRPGPVAFLRASTSGCKRKAMEKVAAQVAPEITPQIKTL